MKYFVLAYDRKHGQLVAPIETHAQSEREVAMRRRFELERLYRGQTDIEIVVLGAESEEAIRNTHGRYFKTVNELLAEMQSTVAAS